MPEDTYGENHIFLPKKNWLSSGEIKRIAQIFTQLGVEKIRLTGGEPLLRKDIFEIISNLNSLSNLNDFALTTNGSLLAVRAKDLKKAGLKRITLSLDSIDEKILKRFMSMGQPNSSIIRAARTNIRTHLDYIGWLCERRNWLVGENFSIADIAAASHLSCIDYLGDVPWEEHTLAKDWYVRVKSRPSFRSLLTDKILGLEAPEHYSDLDF